MITEPKEVDAIVKRGWAKIYAGNVIDIESMVANFFNKYATRLYGAAEYKVTEVTEEMVYQTFKHLKVSAPGMDAWQPSELSLFSRQMCKRVADLFNLIEEGAPWPSSTMHARIMYLEKAGALLGEVMSFRPLTISAPLYRAYATMRLKDMQPWVNQWMTTEMYAGVPGSGATDAWYKVLLDIEQMKVEEQPF